MTGTRRQQIVLAALLGVLAQLGAADSGRFIDWQGKPIPW